MTCIPVGVVATSEPITQTLPTSQEERGGGERRKGHSSWLIHFDWEAERTGQESTHNFD